jgi:hypothetical protein
MDSPSNGMPSLAAQALKEKFPSQNIPKPSLESKTISK